MKSQDDGGPDPPADPDPPEDPEIVEDGPQEEVLEEKEAEVWETQCDQLTPDDLWSKYMANRPQKVG